MGTLIFDGLVERVGAQRPFRYRALRAPRSPVASLEQIADAVNGVLREHFRTSERPLTTRQIGDLLRSRGEWPPRFHRLRLVLDRLAMEDASPSPHDVRPARGLRLKRIDAPTATGRMAAFWTLGGTPRRVRAAVSRADALRHAVEHASKLAGPVSLRELRWWLESRPTASDVCSRLSPARLAGVLHSVERRDRGSHGERGRLHAITSELTCHGGAPVRYVLRPPTPIELAACRLSDSLYALRPADEISMLAELEQAPGSPAHEWIRDSRAALLHAVLNGFAADDRRLARKLRLWLRGLESCFDPAVSTSEGAWYARQRHLRSVARDLDALAVIARRTTPARGGDRRFDRVGEAALLSPGVLRGVCVRAVGTGELRAGRPDLVYMHARRFPRREEPPTTRLRKGGDFSLIDRVDALMAVYARIPDSSAHALVVTAHRLLGQVVRDPAWVHGIPAAGVPEPIRITMLALLGVEPSFAADADVGSEEAAAQILGMALASLDPERTTRHARRVRRSVSRPERRLVDAAIERLQVGRLFTALG